MTYESEKIAEAVQVARMYYYQNLTTETIAQEMNVSRSKISRLLSFAKDQGLVEIHIHDPREHPQRLEQHIQKRFELADVKVVSVPENVDDRTCLDRVAMFAAKYIQTIIQPKMILGIAWGTTVSTLSNHLRPKSVPDLNIVQLNGSGNTHNDDNNYAAEIIMHFVNNYDANAHLLPVPTFFDNPATKASMWQERSIQRVIDLQQHADLLIYSIGVVDSGVPSHVYSAGYLSDDDMAEIKDEGVIGDIATVMFRKDGSYADIPLNARASGPDLDLFRNVEYGICIISGESKVPALHAALRGGFINHLIIDEPSAYFLTELMADT